MDADGANQSRLTIESTADDEPAWKTVGVYSIKGRVVGAGVGFPGVVVSLTLPTVTASVSDVNDINTGLVAVATTDADGYFLFNSLDEDASSEVRPFQASYTFAPESYVLTDLNASKYVSFRATIASYTISGKVTNGQSPMGGLKVTLSGSKNAYVLTDPDGNYSFTVLGGGSYKVKPAYTNYTFSPAERVFSSLSDNQPGQDFTGTLNTHTISGVVRAGTTGLPGVTVTLKSPSESFTPRTIYTNTAEAYSIANLPAGRGYTVTPAKVNYNFAPAVRSYASLNGNQVGQNFSATLKTYTVSGLITNSGTTTGVAAVSVTITSASPAGFAPRTTPTNSSGVYTFAGLPAGRTYTITPAKTGYTFMPLTRSVSNLSGNVTAGSLINFTAVQ